MNKEQGTRNSIEQGTRNIELRSEWLRSIFFIPCSLFNIQKVLCGSIELGTGEKKITNLCFVIKLLPIIAA